MIEIQNIFKYFGSFQALNNVSFVIHPGEIVGFLGQNGAGKTTLMRILTSYLPASSGSVLIDGYDCSSRRIPLNQTIPETPKQLDAPGAPDADNPLQGHALHRWRRVRQMRRVYG